MSALDMYLLARIPKQMDQVELGRSRRPRDLPLSFTSNFADFLFEYAEQHIHCGSGDEILLLDAKLDVADILVSQTFSEHFRWRVDRLDYLKSVAVIRRKVASVGAFKRMQIA